ncbi:hypothetical protein [Nonomuraea sp. NPDC049400]|uniref:hypothetical protein n=1 Tax=Nonomuraea sp. NPDC049400 TaxID=3364352 RepID=UPI0037AF6A27
MIVPCAGYGQRFGAPYPKELHLLADGTSVIDRSLAPVVEFATKRSALLRLVVVIRPHKTQLVDYLARYSGLFELVFVYQSERSGPELSGAIRAALSVAVGPTALVLPDQLTYDSEAGGRVEHAFEHLSRHSLSIVAAPTDDPARLAQEGALLIRPEGEHHVVVAAAEKPAAAENFNAAWMILLASAEMRHVLVEVVQPGGIERSIGAPVTLVKDFVNANRVSDV